MMAREKSINEKWRDWRLDSAFVNEKKGDDKIQVPGIGMYTYDTLKSKVQRMAKDLSDNAKRGKWNKSSRNGIRAFAEMWDALTEYER
tara:strand:+ start:26 stop:289 length:264 start_codon:yes stop_codon:yes gene_type:complete